jgi:tubulin monoglycylase TTLL15
LKKLGLEKIEMNVKRQQKVHNDWDLLWSYDYHNEIPIDFSKVNYYQKVNHIPGNFVLCMKDNLAVNTDSRFIPKAFNNSASLQAFADEHPEARFVQKLWSNRGVELKSADEIDFKVFGPGYKYFAQLYVENPLLLDGRKFDFGVYVLVTSIDPLRIYYYNKNTLIRMCEQKYNPDNYDDVDSYVISDACLFPWEVDALSVYYNKSFTYKEAMNAYFTKKGYDMGKVWREVETAIREIVLEKEYSFIYWVRSSRHQQHFIYSILFQTKQYNFKYSFFELYRFDFMLDAEANLYLIEINQSPNVNPSEKLWRDQRMFESLLFDVFTLLGIGRYVKRANFEFG